MVIFLAYIWILSKKQPIFKDIN